MRASILDPNDDKKVEKHPFFGMHQDGSSVEDVMCELRDRERIEDNSHSLKH
ncbi:MAG: hypothetical protein S4CHLAM2_11530 [Chlamydiales bacterium]|nr:hypothetical protein [Chlamydiales bacterium]